MNVKEAIENILSSVIHPEYEKDIVSLGMVDNLKVANGNISFRLTFKRMNDPFASSIKKACEEAISAKFPQAKPDIIILTKEAVPKAKAAAATGVGIRQVKYAIAIASGKGGVGKSTISVNLAVMLAQRGFKVGLIDADVYGPSIPKMMHLEDALPVATVSDSGEELIQPVEKYGVKTLSIGFFVKAEDPLVWRGPMATSALRQLSKQADWGELDFLLIDLPPGTGDIHLSLVSELKLSGAVVVSTPQDVALADAVKGINFFRQEQINVPILGLVENMAWFTPEELPNNRYYIFGENGCKRLAEELGVPLLGEIPIVQSIREGGDSGIPASLSKPAIAEAFSILAENFLKNVEPLETFANKG